ncbi:MAG TPA: ribosome silencing factor [Burkholderiaceae bacterium]|nr:ribosome silencing factor [Burkholderiaceae bacterium]
MELRKLQRIVVDALEDIKGQDIQVYNTTELTGLFDRVVVVSGTSNRQTRAMASHVAEQVKAAGGEVIAIEGAETGEWVLIDLADIVVHVMQPAIRAYYNLEELWGGKPVRVKLGGITAARQSSGRTVAARGSRSIARTDTADDAALAAADDGASSAAAASASRPRRRTSAGGARSGRTGARTAG